MRKLIALCVLIIVSLPSLASHVIGYEFDYICVGNNTYRFTLSIFRDCRPENLGGGTQGALIEDSPAIIGIFEGNVRRSTRKVTNDSLYIVPVVTPSSCLIDPPIRCISKMVFVFTETLNPSPFGYTLVYQRCCRNSSTLNLKNAGGTGNTFVCTIPPNDINCNNSPRFKNVTPQIICINNPWRFDCSAFDLDGDSLSYEFCTGLAGGGSSPQPVGGPNSPKPNPPLGPPYSGINYQLPYSAQSPMASNPTLSINPTTGIITGTPTLLGIYALSVCCSEWRNGVIINTVQREFQVNVTNCSKAVVADIPVLSHEPNTYVINCKNFTVFFRNNSRGGFSYVWDFGVRGITTDVSTQRTPTYTYTDTGTYAVKLVVNPGSACPDSIERIVKIYPQFNTDYTFTGLFCPDNPIDFTDQSSSQYFPINYWDWRFDDGTTSSAQNPMHSFPNIGKNFKVQLISGNSAGCRDTISKTLNIPKVNLNAGNDTTIVVNEFLQFNATGASVYNWSPGTYLDFINIPNPLGYFTDTGRFQYIVSGSTDANCPVVDTINVIVSNQAYLIIPNAFTPNGDGVNDILRLFSSGYRKINHFRLFNRWGQKVFESNDYYKGWDGKYKGIDQPSSTFFYTISVIDLDNKEQTFRGDVTLIR